MQNAISTNLTYMYMYFLTYCSRHSYTYTVPRDGQTHALLSSFGQILFSLALAVGAVQGAGPVPGASERERRESSAEKSVGTLETLYPPQLHTTHSVADSTTL